MDVDLLNKASAFLTPIANHYSHRLETYGASPQGVFWRNAEGQTLRFELLIGIFRPEDDAGGITVNDLGCGYGAFFDFLKDHPAMKEGRFYGYDMCEDMTALARGRIADPRASFEHALTATHRGDYSFVSGTFNMNMDIGEADWLDYIKASLTHLWSATDKGLAFNMLDRKESTRLPRQQGLYYADAETFIRFCKQTLSSDVELIDSDPLREWTIYVRR
ncbi:MAG: class I SAM-dependent methyltransferase [Rhodospirillales bacterium]|nr:class I SAM-dependent methyltransferase [Rhodospirillales bacterium]